MYLSHLIMAGPKFLSQDVMMKSFFCLSSSNNFSWCLFMFPVGIVLLDIYRFQSSLDNFSICSSTSVDLSRGGGV